jgi:ADP-ribose pyrophosphatase YjhB (NUDIX family)
MTPHSMREMDALLAAGPAASSWDLVTRLVEDLPAAELDALRGRLDAWPRGIRAMPERWWLQLLAGADRDTARADFQALADRLHSENERRRAERDRLRAERQQLAAAPAVAVHAVVTDVQGLVLTAGEALPGGPVVPGETVEAALRRCVAATTGLEVAAGPLTGVYHDARSGAVTLVFRARVTGGEAGDVRWCARPELPGRLPAVFAEAVHDALDAGRAAVPVREAALPDP